MNIKAELKRHIKNFIINEIITDNNHFILNEMFIDDAEVKKIALTAYPAYKGKRFQVEEFIGPMNLTSYWSGGSKNTYALIDLHTLKSIEIPQGGSGHGDPTHRISTLPTNLAVVKHIISQGKDFGIVIYTNKENLTSLLPANSDEISWEEKVVLSATRAYKNTYGGSTDLRFKEANSYTGIDKATWLQAQQNLIQKGLLNKTGSITNNGRNVIGNTKVYALTK